MELNKIIELINAVDRSSLNRFSYKDGNTAIELEKNVDSLNNRIESKNDIEIIENNRPNNEGDIKEYNSIKSSLIGTFYTCPSPDEKPFISVGDKVSKNQVIGVIEVMKMMNEVLSNVDGIVEEILVENNETVEYGQELIRIKDI